MLVAHSRHSILVDLLAQFIRFLHELKLVCLFMRAGYLVFSWAVLRLNCRRSWCWPELKRDESRVMVFLDYAGIAGIVWSKVLDQHLYSMHMKCSLFTILSVCTALPCFMLLCWLYFAYARTSLLLSIWILDTISAYSWLNV